MNELLTMWDFLMCFVAGQVALSLYAQYSSDRQLALGPTVPFRRDIVFGSIIAALFLRTRSWPDSMLRSSWMLVMKAEQRCCVAFAVLVAVGVATRATDDLARLWLLSWLTLFALSVAMTRTALCHYVRRLRGRGALREAIAIVGAGQARERLAARIAHAANVVRTFDTRKSGELLEQDIVDLPSLLELGRDGEVDSVILAVEQGEQLDLSHIVEQLKSLPVQVAICRENGWNGSVSPRMRLLGGLPLAVVSDRPIQPRDLLVKTLLDKIGAAILLFLLAPLLLGIGLAVGITSPGPVIFRQKRQGWCGRDFTVYKFRTMYDVSEYQRMFQTRRNDLRCTAVGRVLRSTSLDELPQLWNVLRGDMSLVGPRPQAQSLHDFERAGREIVAEYAQRHRVKPGITGWAQVKGARGATVTLEQLKRRVDYDLYYIENWSIWLDVRILLHTPFCMTGENAF